MPQNPVAKAIKVPSQALTYSSIRIIICHAVNKRPKLFHSRSHCLNTWKLKATQELPCCILSLTSSITDFSDTAHASQTLLLCCSPAYWLTHFSPSQRYFNKLKQLQLYSIRLLQLVTAEKVCQPKNWYSSHFTLFVDNGLLWTLSFPGSYLISECYQFLSDRLAMIHTLFSCSSQCKHNVL